MMGIFICFPLRRELEQAGPTPNGIMPRHHFMADVAAFVMVEAIFTSGHWATGEEQGDTQ